MFSNWLKEHNFDNLDGDDVTFMRKQMRHGKERTILLTIHVDDGCAACDDELQDIVNGVVRTQDLAGKILQRRAAKVSDGRCESSDNTIRVRSAPNGG